MTRPLIRVADAGDFDKIWPIFRAIVSAGQTYSYDPETGRDAARAIWIDHPRRTFVVEENGAVLGTYYIKTNQAGGGAHVCNCGYMVADAARGKGLANLMCEHSQQVARDLGYKAMQFNFVLATNTGAIRLWERLGFKTVGRLPRAFDHPEAGLVDALVMYKWLAD
ncbi:GNAT family N-acetyltransferase [Actibacterium sp. 188UL27-1]|uniref:GNAT family N-acetyltransferase n=1 Tax=Actibacterium sp. 188UL27-1 TaxID=2786961 RepID=UPI00195AFE3F|nr:GNAT family N-acetyltransferase [Actibacterium sp. 188UL27-1]MBM7069154.1 GNAT family N-acetyltransferase [Actibacterium sp. 188UL27-1]